MNKTILALISTLVISITACTNTPVNNQSENTKKVNPRQGEEVQQVCHINGWNNAVGERNAIIVHDRKRQAYKVSLIGMCDADWAMHKIAMTSKTGRDCLTRGDKIATDATTSRGAACTVMKIHKWLPKQKTSEKVKDQEEK